MKTLARRLLRGGPARLVAAALIGALVGLAAHWLTQTNGRNLFVVTGGVAGVAAVLVLQLYNRAARLTEVKLTVPQFSELTFVVNNDARQVAWKLFVETVTRVSTQPLNDEEGVVREALTSLYSLFATTRDTLKAARPSVAVPGKRTVEHLAITMLNRELRPFLSRWHPRLRAFETAHGNAPESEWPDNAACRAELRRVQHNIYEYAMNFARLAGVHDPEAVILAHLETV